VGGPRELLAIWVLQGFGKKKNSWESEEGTMEPLSGGGVEESKRGLGVSLKGKEKKALLFAPRKWGGAGIKKKRGRGVQNSCRRWRFFPPEEAEWRGKKEGTDGLSLG